ncbi:endonuclease/exonuclease/phosphatase family protein [Nocardioides cheoyonin]|uniref:endonuclease/exonuclease/phosphatase family protein n=1 Tax=Nocardioides cheoyonin TaxID=3156615 RepID=UPI0032B5B3CF
MNALVRLLRGLGRRLGRALRRRDLPVPGARVRWRDLAPALVLGAVLVLIGAVVLFRTTGGPEQAGPAPTPSPGTSAPGLPGSPAPPGSSAASGSSAATGGASRTPSRSASGPPSLDPSMLPTLPGCLSPLALTVMTFNIHGGVRVTAPHRFDLDRIAAEIEAARPDVVLLQEVDRFRSRSGDLDVPGVLGKRLGMTSAFGFNVRHGAVGQYGTAILSRYPIEETKNVPLPRPAGTQQRGLLLARISVSGQQVDIYDTHLENTSATARRLQMLRVRQLLAGVDHPVVLGGDLNSVPGSDVLRIATGFLRDSWAEVGTGPGATHGGRHHLRIDYLLHNSWLRPLTAQVRPSAVSDHRALRVGYALWSQAGCGT